MRRFRRACRISAAHAALQLFQLLTGCAFPPETRKLEVLTILLGTIFITVHR
jgi:hypothetical protein